MSKNLLKFPDVKFFVTSFICLYQFAFKDRVKWFFKSLKPLKKRFYREHRFW